MDSFTAKILATAWFIRFYEILPSCTAFIIVSLNLSMESGLYPGSIIISIPELII